MTGRRPLATTAEVAAYLGVTVATLYQMRWLGKAPRASKVGIRLRWNWADVDAWVEQQTANRTRVAP